jgi:hypothetical protein
MALINQHLILSKIILKLRYFCNQIVNYDTHINCMLGFTQVFEIYVHFDQSYQNYIR